MTTLDETNEPVENKSGAEPNFGSSDDDLAMFALPARTSSSDIQNLVRRHPSLYSARQPKSQTLCLDRQRPHR
jgi:hypothetical protein